MPPAKSNDILSIEGPGPHYAQPLLFPFGDISKGTVELYPTVWAELEKLIIGQAKERMEALDKLVEMNAARFSPLVIFVLTTRLMDTNIDIRTRVIEILGEILAPDENGNFAPDEVQDCLKISLTQMRTRQVYAILQVLLSNPNLLQVASRLMNYCPFAGNHLADVAGSRQAPIEIRRQAILLIGEVGYLDAVPSLERLLVRLESRLNGQHSMPFAPPTGADDSSLIPDLTQTLHILRSP